LTALFTLETPVLADFPRHDHAHLLGDSATHPIAPPSGALAALRILAMAQAIAAVRPCRPRARGTLAPLAKREPSSGRFSSGLALASPPDFGPLGRVQLPDVG
jgi:hypothetical protein